MRATAIYLHISVSRVCFVFASAGSPTKFGFLACGVYPFHPACFHAGSSLWNFYSIFAIAFGVAASLLYLKLLQKIVLSREETFLSGAGGGIIRRAAACGVLVIFAIFFY